MMMKSLLATAILGLVPFCAFAGTYTAHVTAAPGANTTLTVTFTGDGSTDETETRLNFNNTFITITNPVAATGGDTCFVTSATQIRVIPRSGAGATLPAGPFPVCSYTVAVAANAPEGNIPFTIASIECSDPDANAVAPCTLASPSGVTVQLAPVPVGPSIVQGTPTFGSSTNVAGGTLGGAAVTQNITFNASTGGSLGGTTNLVCTDDDANTTLSASATQNSIADGQTPAPITASFTPGSARTVTVSCTATRQGAANQTFSYTFEVAAGVVATGPTLTAPAQTTYTVPGGLIGTFGQTSFQFTAAGGNAGQTTALTCVPTAPVQVVSGGNQSVQTGTQPAPVVVRIPLTNAVQSGTVLCNGVTFTINAPAGSTFTTPEVIPSASTWSKIALFGLLGLFGVMAVGFRRS
jgi:hypothetical protein